MRKETATNLLWTVVGVFFKMMQILLIYCCLESCKHKDCNDIFVSAWMPRLSLTYDTAKAFAAANYKWYTYSKATIILITYVYWYKVRFTSDMNARQFLSSGYTAHHWCVTFLNNLTHYSISQSFTSEIFAIHEQQSLCNLTLADIMLRNMNHLFPVL